MTRKHFVAIADTIRAVARDLELSADNHLRLAREMAGAVGRFNPNFDRERFISQCLSSSR